MNAIRSLVVAGSLSAGLFDAIARSAGPECWSHLPAPLSPHRYHSVVDVGGRAYVVGGDTNAKFEEYDPRTAVWRELPPMPTQRSFPAAVAIGTRIYVLGGMHRPRDAVAVVEEFDLVSGQWRRRADLPSPRNRFAAVVAGGKILAFAGYTPTGGDISVTDVYDPKSDRWESGPPLPLARHGHAAVHVDGIVYILGGYARLDGVSTPQSRVDALNLSTGSWERRPDLPTARGFFGAVAVGEWIYALGGRLLSGAPIERYSVKKNIWETLGEMPAPRERFGAALAGGRIIVVGDERNARDAMSYVPGCKSAVPKAPRRSLLGPATGSLLQ